MTENIFGRLKRKFSILKQLRCALELSQKIVLACCILHNMYTTWSKEDESDSDDDSNNTDTEYDSDSSDENDEVVIPDQNRIAVRHAGQAKRDEIRLSMT